MGYTGSQLPDSSGVSVGLTSDKQVEEYSYLDGSRPSQLVVPVNKTKDKSVKRKVNRGWNSDYLAGCIKFLYSTKSLV